MSTYSVRHNLADIERQFIGKKEVTNNRAPWIKPLWEATTYPNGMDDRAFYCAAGQAWSQREWGKNPETLSALNLTPTAFEKWRCKSASVYKAGKDSWLGWAKARGLIILPKHCILHMGDIVIYDYSHIELVTGDDSTEDGWFSAFGFNTSAAGSANGDGCYEKPRPRTNVMNFVRIFEK